MTESIYERKVHVPYMPRKGYKSITVKEEVYDFLMEDYKKQKKEWLIRKGISSFTGYISYRWNELMEQTKK
jgi:hypothetical protein